MKGRLHLENSGNKQQAGRPTGPDRQEQYQRSRDQAASGQEEQDRDARIRRRAHEMWEAEGRPEGQADRHWSRAAEDLDREDAAIQREGVAVRGRVAGRRGTLISSVIRASGAGAPRATMSA
jgi:hypothetical protein